MFFPPLIFLLRFFCTALSSSVFPDLKYLFFYLRRAFISGLIQGLLLEKGQSVIHTEVNVVSDYGLWCKSSYWGLSLAMKAESHTMTLKTTQHSWPCGVQFFREHIISGMWTRAWLSLFCLCFFLLFLILRLSGLCTADENSVRLPDLTYALMSYRVREHLTQVIMVVKIANVFWAYHHNLCLSPIFLFFFYQIWVWARSSSVATVEIQHESAGWLEAVYDCTRRQPWRV